VLVWDAARFPRVKLCAGWVTHRVLATVEIDPSGYPLTLQPFSRTRLVLDGVEVDTHWRSIASFGIVRREFDDFLLRRAAAAGAEVREGARVRRVAWTGSEVAVETDREAVRARLVVGAGGHHCPVARTFGEIAAEELVVVTLESETRLGRERLREFVPHPGVPELFVEPDFAGYGWYFSKGDYLNIGIGAVVEGWSLRERQRRFVERLLHTGRLREELPLEPFRGHAYAVRARAPRRVAGPGFFLVGDSAGLARVVSGEGIGPAVESGRLAAERAMALLAGRETPEEAASRYREEIDRRFGTPGRWAFAGRLWQALPQAAVQALGRTVCRSHWLRRRLLFEAAFGMGERRTAS
jgi:flavin-dependent dehydrogenase